MISADHNQIRERVQKLDNQVREIKEEIYKIAWFMRGGVSSDDLFWRYTHDDRKLMTEVIKGNIENTKNAKMPLL